MLGDPRKGVDLLVADDDLEVQVSARARSGVAHEPNLLADRHGVSGGDPQRSELEVAVDSPHHLAVNHVLDDDLHAQARVGLLGEHHNAIGNRLHRVAVTRVQVDALVVA